jgi:hypothetical protein
MDKVLRRPGAAEAQSRRTGNRPTPCSQPQCTDEPSRARVTMACFLLAAGEATPLARAAGKELYGTSR